MLTAKSFLSFVASRFCINYTTSVYTWCDDSNEDILKLTSQIAVRKSTVVISVMQASTFLNILQVLKDIIK